jgi:hypothetical protein
MLFIPACEPALQRVWAVIIIPPALFLLGYLFFCVEGMWGIYHRAGLRFRLHSGLFYMKEAAETDGR